MLNHLSSVEPKPDGTSHGTTDSQRQHQAERLWKRHLEDLQSFHSHYGRTPSSIRPVNAGEDRLARWWHRQLVAAERQKLTLEQARLLDSLFSAEETGPHGLSHDPDGPSSRNHPTFDSALAARTGTAELNLDLGGRGRDTAVAGGDGS